MVQKSGYNVYLTKCCGDDSFLQAVAAKTGVGLVTVETSVLMGGAILARGRIFISGRYQPSIHAALGGTPCIFLGSVAKKRCEAAMKLPEISYNKIGYKKTALP